MRRPWYKQARQLGADPRYLLMSVEGALAYHAACLHADDAGTLWCVGDRDAVATLAALLASRRPGVDPAWALASVEEAVGAGLLEVSTDGALLRVVEWVDDAPGHAPPAPPAAPSADERAAAPAAKRPPGRPRKGAAPMSTNERTLRRRFARREGSRFRDVPAGVTFEAWVEAHPAVATKLLRDCNETPPTATKPCNETLQRNHAGGRAGSEPSPSSGTSEEQNTAEGEGDSDARGAQRNTPASATKHRNETHVSFVAASAHTTVETLSAIDPHALFERLDGAVRVDGAARIFVRAGSTTESALVEFVRSLARRGVATEGEVVEAFHRGAREAWVARARRPVTLARVLKDDGELLLEWLHAGRRAPVADADADADAEDAALSAARRRYLSENDHRPTPGDPPS